MESSVLYGKNSVYERLRSNPKSIKKVFLETNFDFAPLEALLKTHKIITERVGVRQLLKIKSLEHHQGVIAIVDKFQYADLDDFLLTTEAKPTIIFLDRVYDPQNLGAIIRTIACFGGFALVVPKHKACEVTDTVMHVASGGENYVPVALVTNISTSIIAAKKSGYWIAGAVIDEHAQELPETVFPFPLGIVFGSEGQGIRQGVEGHLDIKAYIPMGGAKLTFNVAMACAIFCHEISRQRRAKR
jgi:23S rRNA (guanosine2251-2'-O)-methyltransferase